FLHSERNYTLLDTFHSIAFTHRKLSVDDIGRLNIGDESQAERLGKLKADLHLTELMFLSTCNRVEFLFCTERDVDYHFFIAFFESLYPAFSKEEIGHFAHNVEHYSKLKAVNHLLRVASSIDSMIV